MKNSMATSQTPIEELLIQGYPKFDPNRPLISLSKAHPERRLQNALQENSERFSVSPLAMARHWLESIAGASGIARARLASEGKITWNPPYRFILRRLTLAWLRSVGGPEARFGLEQIDGYATMLLLYDLEIEALADRGESHPEWKP